jgi:hypothetical protein
MLESVSLFWLKELVALRDNRASKKARGSVFSF